MGFVTTTQARDYLDLADRDLISVGLEIFGTSNTSVELQYDLSSTPVKELSLYKSGSLDTSFDLSNYETTSDLKDDIDSTADWAAIVHVNGKTENLLPFSEVSTDGYYNRVPIEIVNESTLEDLIESATEWIQNYCLRDFVQEERTEYFEAENQEWIQLDEYPVDSIISITVDGTTISDDEYQAYLDQGRIFYEYGFSTDQDIKDIEVMYRGGFATIPSEIQEITLELISFLWGRSSKSVGSHVDAGKISLGSFTKWNRDAIPDDIKKRLEKYRRYPIV